MRTADDVPCTFVHRQEQLSELGQTLRSAFGVAIDTEVPIDGPHAGELRVMSIAIRGDEPTVLLLSVFQPNGDSTMTTSAYVDPTLSRGERRIPPDATPGVCPVERAPRRLREVKQPPRGYARYKLSSDEVFLSADRGAKLNTLGQWFDLVWATTCEHDAPLLIAPRLGLRGDLPVIEFTRGRADETWKLHAIRDFVGDRPLAWVDDDLGPDAHQWGQ